MFSLSSNFLRSTTIIQSPLTCHGTLLLISSSNTSGVNNHFFMSVIDVSFNLKLVFKFNRFFVYFPLIRVSIPTPHFYQQNKRWYVLKLKWRVMTSSILSHIPTHTYSKKSHPSASTKTWKKNYKFPDYLNLFLRVKFLQIILEQSLL